MTYMEKGSKKRVIICICITDSLCCTVETITAQHCKSTILQQKLILKGGRVESGYRDRRIHRENTCAKEGRGGAMLLHIRGSPRIPRKSPDVRREAWTRFSLAALRKNTTDTLILGFWLQKL